MFRPWSALKYDGVQEQKYFYALMCEIWEVLYL